MISANSRFIRDKYLFILISLLLWIPVYGAGGEAEDAARWERQARNVSIVRDDWGIAHVTGKTDADAVFGMIYAQAEDDFNRVETNYLNALGRLAEAEGESAVWSDLRMKIFIQPEQLKKKFQASPAVAAKTDDSLGGRAELLSGKHPKSNRASSPDSSPGWRFRLPKAVSAATSKQSISGDCKPFMERKRQRRRTSKNLIFSPSRAARTESRSLRKRRPRGHALLLDQSAHFVFFRSELQVTSGEGLNAYGAATWGQIFIYQGFNERLGWMHTSSAVDAIDEWRETILKKGDKYLLQVRQRRKTAHDISYQSAV